MERTKAGLTKDERGLLREELRVFVLEKAKKLGHPEEAIVQEIRYWQQSVKDWRTNPTKKEKEKSFEKYQRICWHCKKMISSFNEATFHHLKRGIPGLHEPENMVPLHRDESYGCHEEIHGASRSLTDGSLKSRKL